MAARTRRAPRELTAGELRAANAKRLSPAEAAAHDARYDDLPEVNSWDDVPDFASEEQEAAFWGSHSLGPRLLAGAERGPGGTVFPEWAPQLLTARSHWASPSDARARELVGAWYWQVFAYRANEAPDAELLAAARAVIVARLGVARGAEGESVVDASALEALVATLASWVERVSRAGGEGGGGDRDARTGTVASVVASLFGEAASQDPGPHLRRRARSSARPTPRPRG